MKATVLPSRRGPQLREQVIEWVQPNSIVYTDEWPAYNQLHKHYDHSRVRHGSGEYVIEDAHTNTIEGFFGNLKTGIRGNCKKVSHKWLQGYLNEFCWRCNHRDDGRAMFETLLMRAVKGSQSRACRTAFNGACFSSSRYSSCIAPRRPASVALAGNLY